jgi:hypothetical protein
MARRLLPSVWVRRQSGRHEGVWLVSTSPDDGDGSGATGLEILTRGAVKIVCDEAGQVHGEPLGVEAK